jgi:hypothetical protein
MTNGIHEVMKAYQIFMNTFVNFKLASENRKSGSSLWMLITPAEKIRKRDKKLQNYNKKLEKKLKLKKS